MYNIAIIGPKDVISGFKVLGAKPFDADDGEKALAILKEMKKNVTDNSLSERFAIIIIIESVAEQISTEDMSKLSKDALPAIISIPGLEGSTGAGIAKLKHLAQKAVGSDILNY